MKYLEATTEYSKTVENEKSLFLGGGITNCPDWQSELIGLLKEDDLVLLNPRRANFPMGDPNASKEQIKWEYRHLRKADAIMFWFPKETLCPIVLYELGAHSMTNKPLFIGVHSDYARKLDVEIQTILVRPEIEIVYDLDSLSEQIKKWGGKF